MRLLSDSYVSESSRNVVCISDEERGGCLESGSGLAPSDPELDSIVVAQSQTNPRKEPKLEGCDDAALKELQEFLSEPEPSGSKDMSGAPRKSKPRVGMSSRKGKKSCSYPKIAASRNYTYDEMIECQEKLNNSDDFQFDIDDVKKEF